MNYGNSSSKRSKLILPLMAMSEQMPCHARRRNVLNYTADSRCAAFHQCWRSATPPTSRCCTRISAESCSLCRISRTTSSLLQRLRIDCTFTQKRLFLLVLADTAYCPSGGVVVHLKHTIWKFPAYYHARQQIFRTPCSARHPCEFVKDIPFPYGPRGSARAVLRGSPGVLNGLMFKPELVERF